jgi:hypothetical protein
VMSHYERDTGPPKSDGRPARNARSQMTTTELEPAEGSIALAFRSSSAVLAFLCEPSLRTFCTAFPHLDHNKISSRTTKL